MHHFSVNMLDSISGIATPGPTRAQACEKLVCALVAKTQVHVINIGLGRRRIGTSNFESLGPPGAQITSQVYRYVCHWTQ